MSERESPIEIKKKCSIEYYEWKLSKFSSIIHSKGNYYERVSFSFSDVTWDLSINPDRYSVNSYDRISLYLLQDSHQPPFPTTVTLAVKSVHGTANHNLIAIGCDNIGSGFHIFFDVSEVLDHKSELLQDDILTILCRMQLGDAPKTTKLAKTMILNGKS